MSLPSEKLDIKTTPKPFGVFIEWGLGSSLNGANEIELQYITSEGKSVTRKIKHPISGILIDGLKAGECIHARLRQINRLGNPEKWLSKHWIECQASADADEILKNILEKLPFSIPAGSLTAISPSPYYSEAGALLSSVDFEKETLSKVIIDMLKHLPPDRVKAYAVDVAEAISKAFEYLDKRRASQS